MPEFHLVEVVAAPGPDITTYWQMLRADTPDVLLTYCDTFRAVQGGGRQFWMDRESLLAPVAQRPSTGALEIKITWDPTVVTNPTVNGPGNNIKTTGFRDSGGDSFPDIRQGDELAFQVDNDIQRNLTYIAFDASVLADWVFPTPTTGFWIGDGWHAVCNEAPNWSNCIPIQAPFMVENENLNEFRLLSYGPTDVPPSGFLADRIFQDTASGFRTFITRNDGKLEYLERPDEIKAAGTSQNNKGNVLTGAPGLFRTYWGAPPSIQYSGSVAWSQTSTAGATWTIELWRRDYDFTGALIGDTKLTESVATETFNDGTKAKANGIFSYVDPGIPANVAISSYFTQGRVDGGTGIPSASERLYKWHKLPCLLPATFMGYHRMTQKPAMGWLRKTGLLL